MRTTPLLCAVVALAALPGGAGCSSSPTAPRMIDWQGRSFVQRPLDERPERTTLSPALAGAEGVVRVAFGLTTRGDQGAHPPIAAGLVLSLTDGRTQLRQLIDSHPDCGCGSAIADPGDLAACQCGGVDYRIRRAASAIVVTRQRPGESPEVRLRHPVATTTKVIGPLASSPPDSDGDGIVDTADRCPEAAEDVDGFEDEDGCPDPDNDQDGFLDEVDKCPLQARVPGPNCRFHTGCPDDCMPPEVIPPSPGR